MNNPNANFSANHVLGNEGDFNGDGTSDLLLYSGLLRIDFVQSATDQRQVILGIVGNNWTLSSTGDFNGDGTSDLLWIGNDNGGGIPTVEPFRIDLINNGSVQQSQVVGRLGSDWIFSGTGDFNGDGTTDILWLRQLPGTGSETVRIDTIKNGAVQQSQTLGTLGSDWKVAGTGDFNGDGTSDILWLRANSDGSETARIDTVFNSAIQATQIIGELGGNWQAAGVGDFNGDGTSDILWTSNDASTGTETLRIDTVKNDAVTQSNIVGTVGNDWHIAGTGDYNHDGTSDILWRRNDGTMRVDLFQHGADVQQVTLGQVGNEWHLMFQA